ncbi:MAG: hypothetical protein NT051_01965 [Candidatus Micrarchaeota archaeon]|nr:hypothetical protein [Candidatus Micrarchaeota archaeon]
MHIFERIGIYRIDEGDDEPGDDEEFDEDWEDEEEEGAQSLLSIYFFFHAGALARAIFFSP